MRLSVNIGARVAKLTSDTCGFHSLQQLSLNFENFQRNGSSFLERKTEGDLTFRRRRVVEVNNTRCRSFSYVSFREKNLNDFERFSNYIY